MNELSNSFYCEIKNLIYCYPFISFEIGNKKIICVSNNTHVFSKKSSPSFLDLVKRVHYLFLSAASTNINAVEYLLDRKGNKEGLLKISVRPQYQVCKGFSLAEINKKQQEVKEELKALRRLGKQEETEEMTSSRWQACVNQNHILKKSYQLFFDVFESLQQEAKQEVFLNFYIVGSLGKKKNTFEKASISLMLKKKVWNLFFSCLKEKYSVSDKQSNQLAIWIRKKSSLEEKKRDLSKNLQFIFQEKVNEDMKEFIENFCLFNQLKINK